MDKKRCLAVRLSNFWALAETDGVELSVLPLFSPSLHPSLLLLPHFWGYRHFTAPMANRHRRGRKHAVVGGENLFILKYKTQAGKFYFFKKNFFLFQLRAFSNIIPDIFTTFPRAFDWILWSDTSEPGRVTVAPQRCPIYPDVFLSSFFSSRLSILVWFMWLFAAVETQIHKLLVPRHWLGSFAQECCLWPPVQPSRLYCGILHLNSMEKEKRKRGKRRAERTAPVFISVIILAIANICVGLIESR